MTFQYFRGQVRGLRGPGLTAAQSADVASAIEGGMPVRPRAVSAIFLETIPATVKRITAQSYYPIGTAGVSERDRGGSDLVEVSAGPQTIWRTQDATGRWWEVVRAPVMRLTQLGAKGGDTFGSAPDETNLINLIVGEFAPLGQVFYLDRVYKVSSYEAFRNPRGCRFIGPGDIVYPVAADPSGPSQYSGFQSAIFDDDDKLESSGEEYLVHNRLRLKAGAPLRVCVFADSRYAGTGEVDPETGWAYNGVLFDPNNYLPVILPQIGVDLGLPAAITVNNLAVPGTTFQDAWLGNTADGTPYGNASNGTTPYGAANSSSYDWLILSFGINEFKDIANDVSRPAIINDRVDATLALWNGYFNYLRSFHKVEDLAITFLGPTSASHIRYQTTDAIKRLIHGLRRLCRLYQVHFVDFFSRWSDSIRMAHVTLDGAYYPGNWPFAADRGKPSSGPLHFLDVQQAALFGTLREHMRRWYVTADATNRFINPSFLTATISGDAKPSAYAKGLSGHEVSSGDGWPAFGYVTTLISGSDDRGVQTLYADGDFPTQIFRRVAVSNADDWHPWMLVGGPSPVHSGAWNFNSVTGLSVPMDPAVINGVLILGQSNAEGNSSVAQPLIAAAPLNATVAPHVLMGDECGARVNLRVYNADKPQPTGPLFSEFVPCREAIDITTQCYETPLTSALTHIHQMIFEATGVRTDWAGATIARGGYRGDQLKQGRGGFEYSRQWVKDAASAAAKLGKKFILRDIFWRSNESDTTAGTPATMLADLLVELANAYNAMIKSVTGQTEDISFWLDCPQDPRTPMALRHNVIEAQRIASASPLIRLGAPYYQHRRSSSAAPEYDTHLSSRGMNNSGVDYARLRRDVLIGDYAPAEPFHARISNAARTEITVECPYAPGLDTSGAIISLSGLPGYYGIFLDDTSGVTITGHTITGPSGFERNIVFTTSGPITGPCPRLLIGQLANGQPGAYPSIPFGPTQGMRAPWYFPGRDITNLFTGDIVRDYFRSCTLLLT